MRQHGTSVTLTRKLDRANVVWRIVKNFAELMRQHSPTSGYLFPASLNQRRLMFRACTDARPIVIKAPPGTAARLNLVSGTARAKPKTVVLAGHLQRVSPAPFMREICAQQQLRWPWSTNQPDQCTDSCRHRVGGACPMRIENRSKASN